MKKHKELRTLLSLKTQDTFQGSVKILIGHKLVDPDLIHTHQLTKGSFQIICKKFHLILLILIRKVKTIAYDIIADGHKTVSFPQSQTSFLHKISRCTAAKIMVKGHNGRHIQLPVEKLHFHVESYRTKRVSSAVIRSILVVIRMLAEQRLTVLFQKSLLFLRREASTMLVIYKQVIHMHVLIACSYGTLAPVILLTVAFSEILLIQKANLLDRFQVHTHAEAHTGRHSRILRTDHAEFIIDLPQRHSLKQFVIPAEIREAADGSAGGKRCSSCNIFLCKDRKHQALQPLFRNLHICIYKSHMIFRHL